MPGQPVRHRSLCCSRRYMETGNVKAEASFGRDCPRKNGRGTPVVRVGVASSIHLRLCATVIEYHGNADLRRFLDPRMHLNCIANGYVIYQSGSMPCCSGTRPVEAASLPGGNSKVCAVEDLKFLHGRHFPYVRISLRMIRSKCGRCGWLLVSGLGLLNGCGESLVRASISSVHPIPITATSYSKISNQTPT